MKHIPIFLASDDNYAAFVAIIAYSILEHTSSFVDYFQSLFFIKKKHSGFLKIYEKKRIKNT